MNDNKRKIDFSLNLGLGMTLFLTILPLFVAVNTFLLGDYFQTLVFTVIAATTAWSYRNDQKRANNNK